MDDITHDMAWEHADILLVEFIHEGMLNPTDAHSLVDSWIDELNTLAEERIEELHNLINKADRRSGDDSFSAMDAFDTTYLWPDVYKNSGKLSQIRQLLINQGYGAIQYVNEVESKNKSETSICVLDHSMIQDI
jgi:hypothetical protein